MVIAKFFELGAYKEGLNQSTLLKDIIIYVVFHKNKKIFYIYDFMPKMYRKILCYKFYNNECVFGELPSTLKTEL